MSQDQKSGAVARESTEVKARRRFGAKYKLRFLEELDAVTQRGGVGRILGCGSLHSSTITKWPGNWAFREIPGVHCAEPPPST